MSVLALLVLGPPALGAAPAAAVEPPASEEPTNPRPEVRRSPVELRVRSLPTPTAPLRGRIPPNEPFTVLMRVGGERCAGDGWGMLQGGYTCLAKTQVVDETPVALPRLVPFDPPTPEEYRAYVRDGTWPRDPDTTEALLPFVYGKAWRHWAGTNYASLEAWERGDPPVATLDADHKYHFVAAVEAARGTALVRDDGRVVPLADAFIYPVSRFHGAELTGADALAPGEMQAWVLPYGGANLREAPNGAVGLVLPHQTPLRVVPTANPRWVEAPDALGPDVPGYVAVSVLRFARPRARPVGLAPDAVWVDIDVSEQVLMLMLGDTPIFATLVSTGLVERDTPPGVYQMLDKTIHGDMASLPDAEEPYHVESVPWVMHFRPRYALHGVFWHWGFGSRASHGCVNLAPLDARRIFDAIQPRLPDGWSSVIAGPDEPGTTVRIR